MTQHGTRLRIDAWLPMKGTSLADLTAAKAAVEDVLAFTQAQDFQITSAKDRVTSRREKPR